MTSIRLIMNFTIVIVFSGFSDGPQRQKKIDI